MLNSGEFPRTNSPYVCIALASPLGLFTRDVLTVISHLVYHIHKKPVPEDGNCYSTSSHLDPYGRTDTPPCDIKAPQTCEVGDLSGKHGPIWAAPGESVAVAYTDWFLSNVEDTPAFFGNLSVVVHAADNTRLTCGNFEKAD